MRCLHTSSRPTVHIPTMAKVDFHWQIAVPDSLLRGAIFDRLDEVRFSAHLTIAERTIVKAILSVCPSCL